MIDVNCGYHHEGYCLKGLPGTLCEVVGCAAHSTASYLFFSDKDTKEKSALKRSMQESVFQSVSLPDEKLSNGDII